MGSKKSSIHGLFLKDGRFCKKKIKIEGEVVSDTPKSPKK